jgi:hypothetical protein
MAPAIVERAIWSIGAVSVPVWPEWELEQVAHVLADARPQVLFAPDRESAQGLSVIGGLPESVRATILLTGSPDDDEGGDLLPYERFMDYGGVLDTAERAAMLRTSARSVKPEDLATIEYTMESRGATRQEVDHATMVGTMEGLSRRFPPAHEGIHLLTDNRPGTIQRALLFAGWADGLTMTAFATSQEVWEQASALRPDVVACREEAVGPLLERIRRAAAEAPGQGRESDLTSPHGTGAKHRLSLFVMDGLSDSLDRSAAGGGRVEYVQPADLDVPPAGGSAAVTSTARALDARPKRANGDGAGDGVRSIG